MKESQFYTKSIRFFGFNIWDLFGLLFLLTILALLSWGSKQMALPFHLGDPIPISLEPRHLPAYALESVIRMLIAMVFSLVFTFTVATLAAKNKHAERLIIPVIDILQSVPVLGFLSISIASFIALFPNSIMGPQCACIFAIFTAQAWNMTLGFYQVLKTIPSDLQEASAMFHLSPWQRFWRIEVPLAVPSLTWNTMMSMSASWVFLVLSEAISVANQNITLPGIGSYISLAIDQADLNAIFYAIFTMFIVIMIYDQLLFRPLLVWAQKFRFEQTPDTEAPSSWFVDWLQRARLSHYVSMGIRHCRDRFILISFFNKPRSLFSLKDYPVANKGMIVLWYTLLLICISSMLFLLARFIFGEVPLSEIGETFKLGCFTLCRVLATVLISSLIWVPLGVWIGQRPRYVKIMQPIIQFLAGFPANLLFPIAVILILKWELNPEIWLTPLMILGSQWYIAFNVVAGTTTVPKEYYDVTRNFGVSGWLWWTRFMLPGIFPYYVTGALTAAGAAWNLSVVTEIVHWGSHTIAAQGLGAYIAHFTEIGDFHRIALSVAMMSLLVVFFNRMVWNPLYRLAQNKYSL
jgi:NitT/TauT family transport system permease protein